MIIGVDAGCLGITDERLQVGVYQVAVNLFKQLKALDTHNTYYLYSFVKIDKKLLKEFGQNVKNIVVKPAKGWTKVWLPLQLLKDKPDIFLGLNQSLPVKLPFQTYKSVVLVHDVLFEAYPSMYPGSYRKLHKESKSSVLAADSIVTVSKAVKRDVVEQYGVNPAEITVAYEGVREFPEVTGKDSKNPYFLFVGALKPQKNIPFLLEGFARFLGSEKQDIDLILVGGDKWKDPKIDRTLKKIPENIQKKIQFVGTVTDDQLASLYVNALAFVSPSISEGFGLPFVEALSFGIPVIGPSTGAIPEAVGEAGILIDPENTAEFVKALHAVSDKNTRLQLQKKASLQASKFSWQQFARAVLTTLETQG